MTAVCFFVPVQPDMINMEEKHSGSSGMLYEIFLGSQKDYQENIFKNPLLLFLLAMYSRCDVYTEQRRF